MAVSVRLPTVLRPHAGGASVVEVDGSTVGERGQGPGQPLPGHGRPPARRRAATLQRFVNVYVNDEDIRYLGKLDTPVEGG